MLTSRPPLSILLVGDTSRRELAAAIEFTESVAHVARCPDLHAAQGHLAGSVEAPDLIVLAQRWPGEFSHDELNRLQRAAPLARIAGLIGSWCEGETRSGRPWAAMLRIEASCWTAWLGQELARLAQGENPHWSLPVTSRDEEHLLHAAESPLARRSGLLVVIAERYPTASAIADACRLRGYATVSLRRDDVAGAGVAGAVAIVWDTISEHAGDPSIVSGLRKSLGNVPIVALLDFPRVQHIAAARASGVSAVLAKPYLIDDLYWQMDRFVE